MTCCPSISPPPPPPRVLREGQKGMEVSLATYYTIICSLHVPHRQAEATSREQPSEEPHPPQDSAVSTNPLYTPALETRADLGLGAKGSPVFPAPISLSSLETLLQSTMCYCVSGPIGPFAEGTGQGVKGIGKTDGKECLLSLTGGGSFSWGLRDG